MKIDSKDERINKLLEIVKEKEFQGYSYDGAGASFEILAKHVLDEVPDFFTVEDYQVIISAEKKGKSLSKAKISINVDDRIINSEGEGNGPVNALDKALRKDLGIYNSAVKDLILLDYKVRILDGGTEAITRVVIESSDSDNKSWFTVGISPNIVEASFEALQDSINYKLMKSES
jgi:2-isopropylmalate synthase